VHGEGQPEGLVVDLSTSTRQTIDLVRQQSDRVILFYSTGKDSIAMLDMVAPHFKEVVCVYMYFVPALDHIDRYINHAKSLYPNVTFLQVPHWNLTWILREGIYCKPNPKVKTMTVKDVDENVRMKTGINFSFYGMKKSDSLNRRLMLNRYENGISVTGKAYPLAEWKNGDVLSYIKLKKLPQPIQYSTHKRSQGLGFDIDVLLYLRKHFSQDLAKILTAFPEAEQILYEYDFKKTTTIAGC